MVSIEEVRAQIRFHLSELSTRNEHHEFERLCYELARVRIATNVIPATGPVGAGGDQGRDFETFRTYLAASSLASRSFLAPTAPGPIVFTCSTQRTQAERKIRGDVRSVMGGVVRPDVIYHFTTANVAVAVRHRVQRWCRDEFGAHLEVIDLQALGDLLADRDVFWIAQRFLHLSAELLPAPPEGTSWYDETRARWADRDGHTANLADLDDLRVALRHASLNGELSPDVTRWIERLHEATDGAHVRLRRTATYETAFASWRAYNSLRGLESRLSDYFAHMDEITAPKELEDAVNLATLLSGAVHAGIVDLAPDDIGEWQRSLRRQVLERLRDARTAHERCALLETAGLAVGAPDADGDGAGDFDATFVHWEALLTLVGEAPLYPLTDFARSVSKMAEVLGEHPRYAEFAGRLDELVAARHGQFAAAEQARERALAFARSGRPLRAIHELHHAKVKWFADEALHGSVLAMLLLSEWYRRIGLTFAAKKYAYAAALAAWQAETQADVRELCPVGVMQAAQADFAQGAWVNALGAIGTSLSLHSNLSPSHGSERVEHDITAAVYMGSVIRAAAEDFVRPVAEGVAGVTDAWKLEDWMQEAVALARSLHDGDEDKFWTEIQGTVRDRPFNDIGIDRIIMWEALGLTWHVTFSNTLDDMVVAEELLATLQIVSSELTAHDLVLLPSTIRVSVASVEAAAVPVGMTVDVQSAPSNAGRDWVVRIATPADADLKTRRRMEVDVLSAVFHMLREVALASTATFDAAVEDAFSRGLPGKLFVLLPYRHTVRRFIDPSSFLPELRNAECAPFAGRALESETIPELGWRRDAGPGYDESEALDDVNRRYERAPVPVRRTLERLREFEPFLDAVDALRAEGWRDWHILQAVTARAINLRAARHFGRPASRQEFAAFFRRSMEREETRDDAELPLEAFGLKDLREQILFNMLTLMNNYGLELHQETPDFPAITRLLVERYRYQAVDQPHSSDLLTPGASTGDEITALSATPPGAR